MKRLGRLLALPFAVWYSTTSEIYVTGVPPSDGSFSITCKDANTKNWCEDMAMSLNEAQKTRLYNECMKGKRNSCDQLNRAAKAYADQHEEKYK